jgi:hypothetical protein
MRERVRGNVLTLPEIAALIDRGLWPLRSRPENPSWGFAPGGLAGPISSRQVSDPFNDDNYGGYGEAGLCDVRVSDGCLNGIPGFPDYRDNNNSEWNAPGTRDDNVEGPIRGSVPPLPRYRDA